MDNHFLERFLNLGPFLEKMNEGKKLAFCFHVFFLIHLLPQGILSRICFRHYKWEARFKRKMV